ncbi:MAG TPA: arabinose isomerase [Firmicutes bacterium]|nr:arabinose isomerase [Bacillota bacterium]
MAWQKPKIGVFYVGLQRYWSQFPGLRERLENHYDYFVQRLQGYGCEVVSAGLVDTVDKARAAAVFFNQHDVDLVMCNMVTYATSATVFPVFRQTLAPIVLVGLQPLEHLDYPRTTTAHQLENDNCTSLPELGYVLTRAGIPFEVVFGKLEDEMVWAELDEWCQVAKVLRNLRYGTLGFLGHTYDGMLDMCFDPALFHIQFGLNIKFLEMCDFYGKVQAVTPEEQREEMELIRAYFDFPQPGSDPIAKEVDPEALAWAAKVSVGLRYFIEDQQCHGLAYFYRGVPGGDYERLIAGMIVGNSLLTGRGIPVAGEGDMKTCVSMFIMHGFGAGGSFAELHPVDFNDNLVLIGHDGPGHILISDEKPKLRGLSLYHGKQGFGVSTEFKVRTGPVTLLTLTQDYDGSFKFVCAEGESLPGPIPSTGNTNSRIRFREDVRSFVESWSRAGVSHHLALGIGKQIGKIKKLGHALGMEVCVVSE